MTDIIDPITSATSATQNEPVDIEGIKQKYEGNIDKMAAAYKDMQGVYTKAVPPKEYEFKSDGSDSLEDGVRSKLVKSAKEYGLTQSQFNKLVDKQISETKNFKKQLEDAKSARLSALGTEEDVEKIKVFYSDKLPSKVINDILENGTPEQIAELKNHRDLKMNNANKPTSKVGDSTMTNNAVDINDKIKTNLSEMQKMWKEHHTPGKSAEEISELESKLVKIGKETEMLQRKQARIQEEAENY